MNPSTHHNLRVTHPSLHIRDIRDAHRVFEAVRLHILPLIKRRLSPSERNSLQSGHVFVWEESDSEEGLVRWTEGKRWSQSKMRGDCLVYEEKVQVTEAEKRDKATRRASKYSESPQSTPPPLKRKDRPTKVGGLTKHTYSVTVKFPNHAPPRKWHLVAYFLAHESSLLPVVEDYDYLRNIEIPGGVFGGHNIRSCGGRVDVFPRPSRIERPNDFPRQAHNICGPPSSLQSANILPPISPTMSSVPLPPLSSLGYFFPKPPNRYNYVPSTATIAAALSQDDRRILEKFTIII